MSHSIQKTRSFSRRTFGQFATASAVGTLLTPPSVWGLESRLPNTRSSATPTIAIFEKILQNMPPEELTDALLAMNADGIESTIRPGGRIPPDEAKRKLPKLVAALERQRKKVLIAATNIVNADDASMELLKILVDNGITHYRMGYYRWNAKKPIREQLYSFSEQARRLAELNERLGLTGCYQNHAGDAYVGSTLWDIDQVFGNIPVHQIGLALDLRHLRAEVGFSWKSHIRLVEKRIGYLFVKDSQWEPQPNKIKNVPLGQGMVSKDVFQFASNIAPAVPLSLHVEYYGQRPLTDKNREIAIGSFRNDIARLRGWIND